MAYREEFVSLKKCSNSAHFSASESNIVRQRLE
jgi:hypothetical protein